MQELTHYIGGANVKGTSGRFADVFNPATGEVQAQAPLASESEMAHAVDVAAKAQLSWGQVNPQRRARVMMKFVDLLNRDMDRMAEALSREHGKTFPDAKGDVQRGLEVVEYCIGAPQLLKGEFTDSAGPGIDMYSMRQPLGVCAGITPFNFPAMIPMWMFAPAIACGNAFILKPSERDPSVPLMLAELMEEAGLPKGILQVVNGDKVAVDRLLEHPDVKALSFVGSTPIAKYVYASATAHGKRAQALGGAKNHMVVLPDADVEMAADAAVSAAYGSAGERCMAISVVVAVGDVGDQLVDAIKVRMEKLVVGPGTDPGSEMGPLITREARDRVAGYVQAGADAGCEVVVDGRDQAFDGDGFFLGVTLLDHVTTDMSVYTDEIFGPVLSVVRADSYADGVQMIRDNPFGNGAAIFTRDGGAARQFQRDADAGMVGINVPIPVPVGYHSFGGWNDSAFGDTTMYGPEGLRFYTRPKVLTSRWPDPSTSSVDLGFPRND